MAGSSLMADRNEASLALSGGSPSPYLSPRGRVTPIVADPPSPKRARQTPLPSAQSPSPLASGSSTAQNPAPQSASQRPRSRLARPTLADKRAVTFDRHVMTSPYRSASPATVAMPHALGYSNGDRGLVRRRELSVPLLSQSMSHFSLSHTSPPTPHRSAPPIVKPMTEMYRTSPLDHARTPRHPERHFDWSAPQPHPRELVYPSTAPLPQAPAFLGSPFSSRTARGGYRLSGPDDSPSRSYYGAKTDRLPQGAFESQLDWMSGSEWMADEIGLDVAAPDIIPFPSISRRRRDTSGSSSSVASLDDASGSGTSSASLLSLGRSSDEHKVRPGVTIWGEYAFEEEIIEHETPSRQLFHRTSESDDALQMPAKGKKGTPSPIVGLGLKDKAAYVSPVEPPPSRLSSLKAFPGSDPDKARKSPFASFIPRLMSARRPHFSRSKSNRSTRDDEDEATDTEDVSSPCNRQHPSTSTLCDTPTARVAPKDTLIGLGITSADKASCSFSSESSIEISSPSKLPSGRASKSDLAGLSFTPGPIPLSIKQARRKTLAAVAAPAKQDAAASTTTLERAKPLRPLLRRGVTEPRAPQIARSKLLHPDAVQTPPPMFGDIKPSPAAFASTGLVKKKSGVPMLEIPRFGSRSSPVRAEGSETTTLDHAKGHPRHPSVSPNPSTGQSASSASSGPPSTSQNPQRTRGLRRKGSTMFTASGSSGSIGDGKGFSPVTPTKPFQVSPFGLNITTPLPPTTPDYYPFATSTSAMSVATLSPDDNTRASGSGAAVPFRLQHHRGPVARASNPMLAASYLAGAKTVEQNSGPTRNRLDTDFVLVQSLGAGAFSQVWKVRDKKEGKLWAVKAGKPYTGAKNRLRQLEEVSILHSLSLNPSAHILHFVDSWEHRNRLYLRTELAECGDLARFLEALGDIGGLGEIRCWKLLSELTNALKHVHSRNILHLDVKPSNILITRSGSLKLADFGMSTISGPSGQAADLSPALPVLGSDGGFTWSKSTDVDGCEGGERKMETVPSPIIDREIEGDREYLCPEALGSGAVGREADVFSLGIMVLEAALNVVLPSNGDGWVKLRNNDFSDLAEHYLPRQEGDVRLVAEDGRPVVSAALLGCIKGMMCPNPAERWTLEDIRGMKEVRAVAMLMEDKKLGPACVEEDGGMLDRVL